MSLQFLVELLFFTVDTKAYRFVNACVRNFVGVTCLVVTEFDKIVLQNNACLVTDLPCRF